MNGHRAVRWCSGRVGGGEGAGHRRGARCPAAPGPGSAACSPTAAAATPAPRRGPAAVRRRPRRPGRPPPAAPPAQCAGRRSAAGGAARPRHAAVAGHFRRLGDRLGPVVGFCMNRQNTIQNGRDGHKIREMRKMIRHKSKMGVWFSNICKKKCQRP